MMTETEALPPELAALHTRYAVYRCFSDHGQLLYIGSTGGTNRRFMDHSQKIWFLEVRGITFEWYADELDARNAERRAIHVEHPKYNVVHRNGRTLAQPKARGRTRTRQGWPLARSVGPEELAKLVSAAVDEWDATEGRRLPALRLANLLEVRMNRTTAKKLIDEAYASRDAHGQAAAR